MTKGPAGGFIGPFCAQNDMREFLPAASHYFTAALYIIPVNLVGIVFRITAGMEKSFISQLF